MATIRWSDASAAVSIYPTCILKVLGKMDKFNGGFHTINLMSAEFELELLE